MTDATELKVVLEARFGDFERKIEDEFKPALRAAIEQVMCDFLAEIASASTVATVEAA